MSFQARIEEAAIGTGRLYTLKTGIEDVVSWRGTAMANPVFERGDEVAMEFMVGLLDKGTKRRDRFAIADILENRGAQVGFHVSGVRLGFWGRSLRGDVPAVLAIMAEQLREPLFDAEEFEKVKQRMLASVRRSMENTGSMAAGALSRRLYPPSHPNYRMSEEEELERVSEMTRDQVVDFYERHIGANAWQLVMVGDLEAEEARAATMEGLGDWAERAAPAGYAVEALPASVGARDVRPMADRPNLDVRIGHALALRRDHPDYPACYLANHILGGTFSSRLMDVIRDDMGLTYGIYASLNGISTRYDGHWNVSVSLSQENLERGIEATLAEVRRYVAEGPTEREVTENIDTIVGTFKVRLATTGGLAEHILAGVRNGFGTGYLDTWPQQIAALGIHDVRTVIQRYLRPEDATTAIAGTLP